MAKKYPTLFILKALEDDVLREKYLKQLNLKQLDANKWLIINRIITVK